MANVTRERTGEFLRILFAILLDNPEGIQAKNALSQLQAKLVLSEYEAGSYESGGMRFHKIVRFATVDCVKAGWMLKIKGKWFITSEGEDALGKFSSPDEFYKEATRLYRKWKSEQSVDESTSPDSETEDAPEKEVSITYEQAEEVAWEEIREHLATMNPYEFQDLVAELLEAMGYHSAWVAPKGKDGGIDILVHKDPLGATLPRIKVQVKRMQTSVSVDGLRSFMAVLGDDDVGIFVNLAGFTRDAEIEARTQEKRRVTLINQERLVDLWIEHYADLDETARRRLPLKPIYFLSPEG
ncbi:MAG: restriction endonuclease [Planctomycetota bacterium]|nr:restriction endonuclease [Planctomycetota bacterium]